LHDRIRDELKKKKSEDRLKIVIVFGKNEDDKHKSLSVDDLNFFKEFPNIEICYEKNLHAKYYASDQTSLITSMNLHQFSQNNNIEVGIQMFPKGVIGLVADVIKSGGTDCDGDSMEYFDGVIKNSEKLFVKTPQYDSGIFSKTYTGSTIGLDKLDHFFQQPESDYTSARSYSLNQYSKNKPFVTNSVEASKPGFCIRTGVQIPFNPSRPLSNEAYKSWSRYSDPNYAEKFCHFSGEPSNGETSVGKPIMKKNWSKAKGVI
jgi:hypothetical protein